jgi:hypothetical protein
MEILPRNEERLLLEYVNRKDFNFVDKTVLLATANLVMYQDETLYAIVKYLAFQEMFTKLKLSEETKRELFTLLFLQGEFNRNKQIQSKLKNTFGNFQVGVVYKAENIFVNFALTLSTLDFEADPYLPSYHRWGRIQLGIYF